MPGGKLLLQKNGTIGKVSFAVVTNQFEIVSSIGQVLFYVTKTKGFVTQA